MKHRNFIIKPKIIITIAVMEIVVKIFHVIIITIAVMGTLITIIHVTIIMLIKHKFSDFIIIEIVFRAMIIIIREIIFR